MQSFWQYLRRAAEDAVLAGVEDALRALEQGQSIEAEAKGAGQLATRLAKVVAKRIENKSPTTASEARDEAHGRPSPEEPNASAQQNQPPDLFDSETEPVPSLTESPSGHLRTGKPDYAPRGKRGGRHPSRHRGLQ